MLPTRSEYLSERRKATGGFWSFWVDVAGGAIGTAISAVAPADTVTQRVLWGCLGATVGVLVAAALRWSVRFVWTAPLEMYRAQAGQLAELRADCDRRLSERPNLTVRLVGTEHEVRVEVTNEGAVADVWSSVTFPEGRLGRLSPSMFAKWENSDDRVIRLARGETRRLVVGILGKYHAIPEGRSRWSFYAHVGEQCHEYPAEDISDPRGIPWEPFVIHGTVFCDPDGRDSPYSWSQRCEPFRAPKGLEQSEDSAGRGSWTSPLT